ncbi:MAG: SCP2 sterol-binding domain-containing protein [Eubacterium sp.]|jgi:SCP-2 sterol transfer family.|nr:SCP2 sterol-binding domain-containing protein [Eubacterium sp.]
MRVNIYYGGRGLIDDPTIYVIERISKVLDELRVNVERYNLYEEKSNIAVLPKTLKEADGVILAASVEWLGIGGNLQQFLDSCWLYGDKEKISHIYMLPVVMATTYGEREAEYDLIHAWEMLGGVPCEGLCAYVENHVEFETNAEYNLMIEKKAENFYRTISKKMAAFPNSSMQVKKTVLKGSTLSLTPQESEQLSVYVSNDKYVKKQKEDIEELASLFKGMLGEEADTDEYTPLIRDNFYPLDGFKALFRIDLTDRGFSLVVDINEKELDCYKGTAENADVTAKMGSEVLSDIVHGKKTFQSAFMSGDLSAQGNFKILRNFDTVFRFN